MHWTLNNSQKLQFKEGVKTNTKYVEENFVSGKTNCEYDKKKSLEFFFGTPDGDNTP